MLRDEINNIALRIVKAREAKNNLRYNPDSGKIEGNWRVPTLEKVERAFTEQSRFFHFSHQKKVGLKFVPPPAN
jgi:hypothetical protein